MSVPAKYVLYAVNTNDGLIDQINAQSISPQIQQIVSAGDGKVRPEFAATAGYAPLASITTTAIKTVMDIVTFAKAYSTAVDFYFAQVDQTGRYVAGANHMKISFVNSLVVLRTLQAASGAAATIQIDIGAISDSDVNAPYAVSTGQALPGSPADDERYTIGPVKINNTLINGVLNLAVDFGISASFDGSDGSPVPTRGQVDSERPTIRIETRDATLLSTLSNSFDSVAHAGQATIASSTVFSLWKMANHAIRVSKTTAEHITGTVSEGRVTVDSLAGQGVSPAQSSATITPTYDGANAIIAWDTAASLPS